MAQTVHVNSLRWFAEKDGGADFVASHGDAVDDDTVGRALTTAYPDARQLVRVLREAGVGADCWFTLSSASAAASGPEPEDHVRALAAGPVSLGGLSLAVGGDSTRIGPHVAVTGLTCTGPEDEALARAVAALAAAFGPQVVWDDGLADVMLVRPGMTVLDVRTRWSRRR